MKNLLRITFFIGFIYNVSAQQLEGAASRPKTPPLVLNLLREIQSPKGDTKFKNPPKTYSGFLVELRKSKYSSKTFSLKNKTDELRDGNNLITDILEPTKPKGIRLLSLDF